MTNKHSLRSFLFLLTASSLVSGRRLLGLEEKNPQNATVSAQQYSNISEHQFTSGSPPTTVIREERSSAAPTLGRNTSETAHGQPSQGNGTSENLYTTGGTESTKHHSAGNESLARTESPLQTSSPEQNGSLYSTVPNPASTFSGSVGPRPKSNATSSVPIVVTTRHAATDGPSSLRTTVKPMVPSTTEIRTTRNHTPTESHSTLKPNKSTPQICPTAESKKESIVGLCLIAIAGLAALATIFIMTTIILATKLAGSRYRNRASLLHETEMVCISALMNDSDHPLPTPKRPKSNGALIPITADEEGDDLTLHSFLHDVEGVA